MALYITNLKDLEALSDRELLQTNEYLYFYSISFFLMAELTHKLKPWF